VRLLAAVAIGLSLALVSIAVSRGSAPGSSWWRSISSGSDTESDRSLGGAGSAVDEPSSDTPMGTPTPRRGGLLIDGGDYTGPDAAAAPTAPFTPTPSPVADDGDEDTVLGANGGASVTVPDTPTPKSTADDGMLAGIVSRGGAIVPPTPLPERDGLPWVGGQGRGYAMLYALQPEARAVV
jgi:hypothetical protein